MRLYGLKSIITKLRTSYAVVCTDILQVTSLVLLQSVSWSLAEFRHNKIVQSPHENYFNVCRQHIEK